MEHKRGLTYVLVLLMLVLPSLAFAGGFSITEFGSRQVGAAQCIAGVDDLSAIYHNPANLADIRGINVMIGFGFAFVGLEMKLNWDLPYPGDPDGENYLQNNPFINDPNWFETNADGGLTGYFKTIEPEQSFGVLPLIVFSTDMNIENFTFALGIYVPNAIAAYLPEDAPSRFLVKSTYFIAGYINPAVAYRLNEYFSFGAGVSVLVSTLYSNRDIAMEAVLSEGQDPLWLDVNAEIEGWTVAYTVNFGVTFNPIEELALSLMFVSEANPIFDADIDISLNQLGPDTPPLFTQELVEVFLDAEKRAGKIPTQADIYMLIPFNINFGINWFIIPELEVGFDFRYWFYSSYKEQRIVTNVDPNNDPYNLRTGMTVVKNFTDVYHIGLGFVFRPIPGFQEIGVNAMDFMVGGMFDKSPSPDETWTADNPSLDTTGFTLGYRWQITEEYRIFVSYYHYWYIGRDIRTSTVIPPSNVKGEGWVDSVTVNFEMQFDSVSLEEDSEE